MFCRRAADRAGGESDAEGDAKTDRIARLVVGAPWSGSGKTTVTLVLTAGLMERGHRVQSYKVGPDYIDGTYHTALTGRPTRNLDLWMGGTDDVLAQFERGAQGAGIAVVEGVMGLFDSATPDGTSASTAEMARVLRAPLLLVLDGSQMAESAAAIVYGCHRLEGSPGLAGVILNRIASPRHFDLLQAAIAARTGVPVLGYLPARPDLAIPERHLGLVPAAELPLLAERLRGWAEIAADTLDWDRLERLAGDVPPLPVRPGASRHPERTRHIPVALARDEAFHFYYAANLELLEDFGAELLPFSPLRGEPIPSEARMLYVGGGFPEEFLPRFRELGAVQAGYRRRITGGLLTLAECGGYLWLGQELARARDQDAVPMVGVVPARMRLEPRLQGFGYREITALNGGPWPAGTVFRGHEFHHARVVEAHGGSPAWKLAVRGREVSDGFLTPSLVAGFPHLYFPSHPDAIRALMAQAAGRGL